MTLIFRCAALAATCFTVSAAAAGEAPQKSESRDNLRLLVPAYFYPGGEGRKEWDRLIDASKDVPTVVIANPASGPGDKADENYTEVIHLAAEAGATVIGYVTTSYNTRPKKEVLAEIDRWLELYPEVRGIFFDEQASGGEHAAAMIEYARYVREKVAVGPKGPEKEDTKGVSPLVVSNPGTWCDARFFAQGGPDVICIYENKSPLSTVERPRGAEKLPPHRLAALAHSLTGKSYARSAVRDALRKKLGYLYVTDAPNGTKNPWDRLPGEWDELVKDVAATNDE